MGMVILQGVFGIGALEEGALLRQSSTNVRGEQESSRANLPLVRSILIASVQ